MFRGEFASAAAICDELPVTPDRAGLRVLSASAMAVAVAGRPGAAVELVTTHQGLLETNAETYPTAAGTVLGGGILALWLSGQIDLAHDLAVALGDGMGDWPGGGRSFLEMLVGRARFEQGRVVDAGPPLVGAVAGFRREDIGQFLPWALAMLARQRVAVGDVDGAREALAEADAVRRPQWRVDGDDATAARSGLAALEGRLDEARRLAAERADGLAGRAPVYEALARFEQRRLGDTGAAARLGELAMVIDSPLVRALAETDGAALEAMGFVLLAADAWVLTAEAADPGPARAAAVARARALHARVPEARTPMLDRLDALDPTEVRLTRREREVAELAAAGLSNPEIAARLVVSRRTVDSHLEHAYAKLGISNRAELAKVLRPA